MISQGDIWWAELGEPAGASLGYRRPVVVIQGEAFNRSRIDTVVCVVPTSNLRWAEAPGSVRLGSAESGLPRESVADVSRIVTLDRSDLAERVGLLAQSRTDLILAGVDVVLGR